MAKAGSGQAGCMVKSIKVRVRTVKQGAARLLGREVVTSNIGVQRTEQNVSGVCGLCESEC